MISNIISIIENYYGLFFKGFAITILLAILTVVIGIVLGFFIALLRLSKNKLISSLAASYIEVLRGLPLLLQLWVIYIAGLGIGLSAFTSVLIALGLNSGAYVAEIFRAGIQAVDSGQREAGVSLGLSKFAVMSKIILPQAIKNIVPALGNEFVMVIKETSLGSVFYIGDIMTASSTVISITYLSFEVYIIIGAFYFIATFSFSKLVGMIEKGMKKSDKSK